MFLKLDLTMVLIVFPERWHVSDLSQSCLKVLKLNSKSKIQLPIYPNWE